MKKKLINNKIVIYQGPAVVSRHTKNIFKDGEINRKSNMQKMHIASFIQNGGNKHVLRLA